jgi:hypothetical protein
MLICNEAQFTLGHEAHKLLTDSIEIWYMDSVLCI